MALPGSEEPDADRVDGVATVRIAAAAEGGWDVTVTVGGRTIGSCHCNDWHRAERARRCFEFAARQYLRRIAATAAALVMMATALGVPTVARAQNAPDGIVPGSDLKCANNSIDEYRSVGGLAHWYVARGLGSGLGTTGRFAPEKGDPEALERDAFILDVRDGFVEFDYGGSPAALGDEQ